LSRSRRRHARTGATLAASDKRDKRFANRRWRRAVRVALDRDPLADAFPHRRELTDPWDMAKDGKIWIDPARSPRLMRK